MARTVDKPRMRRGRSGKRREGEDDEGQQWSESAGQADSNDCGGPATIRNTCGDGGASSEKRLTPEDFALLGGGAASVGVEMGAARGASVGRAARVGDCVIKIPSRCYIHVQDKNTLVTSLKCGPTTYTCLDSMQLVLGPEPMVVVPPGHFCVVANPVVRDGDGRPLPDGDGGAVLLRHGDMETRLEGPPFPLYPGEAMCGGVRRLPFVPAECALKIRALRDVGGGGEGAAAVAAEGERGRAVARRAGEETLVEGPCFYVPNAAEEVVDVVHASVLTETRALSLLALGDFCDRYGVERRAGDQWLVTSEMARRHLPDVLERVVEVVPLVVLGPREWCVLENPARCRLQREEAAEGKRREADGAEEDGYALGEEADGKRREAEGANGFALGERTVLRGPRQFFPLPPHERIQQRGCAIVVPNNVSCRLTCQEPFIDASGCRRLPGEVWFLRGPAEYWPRPDVAHSLVPALIDFEMGGRQVAVFPHEANVVLVPLFVVVAAFLLLCICFFLASTVLPSLLTSFFVHEE